MSVKLIRSFHHLDLCLRGGVLTIGNFDGVHLGHQQLIAKTVSEAKARGVPAIAMTFEPHPFEFFAKQSPTIPRITRLREKFTLMRELGLNGVLIVKFNQQVANMGASDFIEMIKQTIDPVHIVIGDDFHFGKQRQGDFALLQQQGRQYGFSVEAMPTVSIHAERVSSTRVRKALIAGDLALACELLGRPYSMLGRVCAGDQLGRKLGFPTANLFVHRQLTAVSGIFIVKMHGIASEALPGVANIGTRPTIDGTRILLEVHLLDFNKDIYDRYVEVEFIKKIRDEERYSSLDLLQAKIAEDVAIGRDYFNQDKI